MGIKKHINSHFEQKEQFIETSEPPLVSSEFVSINELKSEIDDDRPIPINVPSQRLNKGHKTQSADKAMSSPTTHIAKVAKRKFINETNASERIVTKDTTHSTDKSKTPPTTKVVKIVKLKRIKPNPRLIAMKKKVLTNAEMANGSKILATLKNLKAPPKTTVTPVVDVSHLEPNESVHRQSCYQCEMEPQIQQPTDPRRHICLFCPIWFSNHVWFELHVTNIHEKDYRYVMCQEFYCYVCEQSFPSRENLISHLNTHKEPKIFLCDICGSTHKTKSRMVEHIKKHDGRKIECGECGKTFHSFSALRQHLWLHDTDPSFVCTVCLKAFKMKRYLDRHMVVHDEPKIRCRHCEDKFHFVTVRNAHERSRHHV